METIRRQLAPQLEGRTIRRGWAFDSPKFTDAPMASGHRIEEIGRRGKYLIINMSCTTPSNTAPSDSDPNEADAIKTAPHEADAKNTALDNTALDNTALDNTDSSGTDGLRAGRSASGCARVDRQLVVHLGMTGRLAVTDAPPQSLEDALRSARHLRASWSFDDGTHLGFWDQRRFGRVAVVEPGSYSGLPTLNALGPEPFGPEFTGAALKGALSGRKAIKTALLDQRVVAGVGNIYADEALWIAGISPTRRRLGAARAADLRDAIVQVLRAGIEDGGTTLRDYRDAAGDQGRHQERLRCYGRSGLPCDRCGRPLSRKMVDARSTTWCRSCQT